MLAVIQIIRGGLLIATSGSIGSHTEGRELITQAILGLVLVLSPVLVFYIINPSILNLSANIPPLNISRGNANGDATNQPASVETGVAGCTAISGPAPGTVLATCSSKGNSVVGEDTRTAQGEAAEFVAKKKCGNDDVNAAFPVILDRTLGSVVKVYCSPKITGSIFQEVRSVPGSNSNRGVDDTEYRDIAFLIDKNFLDSCRGDDWELERDERVTESGCPTNDPKIQAATASLPNTSTSRCVFVTAYCKYDN